MRGIFRHDLYSGIYCRLTKIMTFGMIFLVAGIMSINQAVSYGIKNLSFMENMAYIFYGCKPFADAAVSGEVFSIPIVWMVIQSYLAYIIGGYPLSDMKNYGINLLVRTKSRVKWWMGKLIWSTLITIIAYAIGYAIVFLLTMITNGGVCGIRPETLIIYNDDLSMLNNARLVLTVIVFPIITAIATTTLQMAIMILADEITAYGVIGLLCIAGAFYNSTLLLPGNSMVSRSSKLLLNDSYQTVFVEIALFFLISVIAGLLKIKKKSIYDN